MGRVGAAAARFGFFCATALTLASCAETPPPPPPPPAPVATLWPTNGWQTSTPEAQGIDSKWLAYAVQMIQWKHMPVNSLLVERHGYIVLDTYFYPFADNQLHDVASVTKSVMSTLVGIAQAKQEIISLDTPVLPVLSEETAWSADARKRHMTLAHLLSMTSGLDCSAKDGQNFLQQMESTPHWSTFALERPQTANPGTQFNYCAANMQLVSALLTHETGESAASFAQRELFGPLGIRNIQWPSDPDGVSHGFADLKLQPRDMAKLGYLWLHHGVWEGRQIVPQSYLDAALSPHADVNVGVKYGYGIWLYPNGRAGGPADFEANGHGGQRIAVIPSKDTVIVITGNGVDDDEIARLLAPAAKWDAPLRPNPQADTQLAALATRVAAPQGVVLADSSKTNSVSGSVPEPLARPNLAAVASQASVAPQVATAQAATPPAVAANGASDDVPAPVAQPEQPVVASQVVTLQAATPADSVSNVASEKIPVPSPQPEQPAVALQVVEPQPATPADSASNVAPDRVSVPSPQPDQPVSASQVAPPPAATPDSAPNIVPTDVAPPPARPDQSVIASQVSAQQTATPPDNTSSSAPKNLPVPLPRPKPPAVVAQTQRAKPQDVILADGTARIVPAPSPQENPSPRP